MLSRIPGRGRVRGFTYRWPWLSSYGSVPVRFQSDTIRPHLLGRVSVSSPSPTQNSNALKPNRSLATARPDAIESSSLFSFDHNPFTYTQQNASSDFLDAQDANPSLIIFPDHLEARPRPIRRSRGIGGDINEMLANLDVCLASAMFDRAGEIVHRIGRLYPSGALEMQDIHNKYLHYLVSHMIYSRNRDLVAHAQKWFEVDLKTEDVAPDAITYAWMLKMSLRFVHGTRGDRCVRRYWDLCKEDGIEEDVLTVPILSESELGRLSQICASDFQNPIGLAFGEPSQSMEQPVTNMDNQKLRSVPEIRSVEQKGLGLSSLKESLSLFTGKSSVPYEEDPNISPEQNKLRYAQMRQRFLETQGISIAANRWKEERANMPSSVATSGNSLNPLLSRWHDELTLEIDTELALMEETEKKTGRLNAQDSDRIEYAPYLRIVGADKLAALTIISSLNSLAKAGMDKGVRLVTLVTDIGKGVYEEYVADRLRSSPAVMYGDLKQRSYSLEKVLKAKTKKKWAKDRFNDLVTKLNHQQGHVVWSPSIQAKIGALLAGFLFDTAKIPVKTRNSETRQETETMQPAFRRVYQLERGHRIGHVLAHESLVSKLSKESPGVVLAKHLPMVCPPRPWTGVYSGGFLDHQGELVRIKSGDRSQLRYVEAAAAKGQLQPIFDGLSALGQTGWCINRRVFDIMLEAWNSGDPVANLAPADPKIRYPERPQNDDLEAMRKYTKEWQLAENLRQSLHSQRCFQNFQLEIARSYLGETFYLPHNLDFRGRAYPMVPYFNQMCADSCRGLLLFNKGKKLGERGLQWLKIHLATVYGFDKASFSEREQFTMDHLDDVRDAATLGLHGRRWWLEAEDAFQCLAACIELTNALSLEDPTEFVSHLPVHQDGSCNGLQHYAALGGDVAGAKQVNLEPSDRPSDIYTAVAEHVKDSVQKDIQAGDQMAKVLEGKITRKIVKQTVMTNVYGVTFLGAIRQVRRQIDDHYPELKEYSGAYSTYIARKIFQALGSMFSGAHNIQFWLGDCAVRITSSLSPKQVAAMADNVEGPRVSAKNKLEKKRNARARRPPSHFKSSVTWTTPLKLPVMQPYREVKSRVVNTNLQAMSIQEPHGSDVVDKRKQLQAFPPNYIHSLDATHMLLSAAKCAESGLTFSAVHDSYWTHAADIDVMSRILRDAFVSLHSNDLIERLAAEFKRRFGNNMYQAFVRRNSPVAKKILAWRRSHKNVYKIEELVLEFQRLELLRSDDAKKQSEGRAMVTPASLLAEDPNGMDALESTQSLGVAASGEMPPEPAVEEEMATEDDNDNSFFELGVDRPFASPGATGEVAKIAEKPKRKTKPANVPVWLPLTFRDVPAKGEFDVRRLKDSQYFFS